MNCSICDLKGITQGELLCPRCGSLVDREEIIYQEDDKLISIKEHSVLKGKVVELANKKERYKTKISNQKIVIGFLLVALLWSIWHRSQEVVQLVESPTNNTILLDSFLLDSIQRINLKLEEYKQRNVTLTIEEIEEKAEPQSFLDEYIVKKGDTLSKIAMKFYNDMNMKDELKRINNIKNEDLLHPGEVIKLVDPNTIKKTLINKKPHK